MIENGQTVGFVREHHKHSLRSQRGLMASHRITKIYEDLALCIQQRRVKQGDVVAVKRLALLADPRQKRRPGGVRQALYKAVDDLEAAGAFVTELDTGRSTKNPRDRDLMLRDAIDELSRTRYGSRKIGRPARTWTAEQRTIMRLHWFDLRHASNADAVEAMRTDGLDGITASVVQKLLGRSGRSPGPKATRR
jgi:Asp-tRNA(Asn)/Glu-tRNA(Gln) amidotransferase A subunit family amidase